jgi:tetratricopeptide (TPR) repeat protein
MPSRNQTPNQAPEGVPGWDSGGPVVFIRLSKDLLDRIQARTAHYHDHARHDPAHSDHPDHDHDHDEPCDRDYDYDDEEVYDRGRDNPGTAPSPREEAEAPEPRAFVFDSAIPIPVELPAGEDRINLEELSLEMILSGMLRLISNTPRSPAGRGPRADWGGQDGPGTAKETTDYASLRQAGPGEGPLDPAWHAYYRSLILALRPAILPEFTEAAILKARNGDYSLALEILAALKGIYPDSPSVLLNRAMVLEERAGALERAGQETAAEGDYLAAEAAYGEALALDPPIPNALFNAGHFFLKRRDYGKALVCLRAYTSLEDLEDGAGGLALEEDKRENALLLIREIEDHGLEDEDFREAWEHIRRGREREGMERIRHFLERRPGVWNGWFLLGWALRRLERWDDARSSLEKALELGGDTSDIRNELAICLMELNDYPGARGQLETALRRDPENIKIISNLGVLAMRSGKNREAAGFFRTVLELEPEDPLARRYVQADGGANET